MRADRVLAAVLLTVVLAAPAAVAAEPEKAFSLGFRAGVSAKRTDGEYFHLYEGVADFPLPQSVEWSCGWRLRTGISVHAGMLRAGQDNGFILTAGPNAKLDLPGGIFFFTAGARAGFMTDYRYGEADLGGPFTFETDIGVSARLGRKFSAGYHWQHLSNANVYDQNPSVNLHAIEVTYRF